MSVMSVIPIEVNPPTQDLSPTVAAFEREMMRRHLSQRTIQRRLRTLSQFFTYVDKSWLEVSERDICEWIDERIPHARTQNVYMDALRHFGRFCKRQGIRPDDPTEEIPLAKTPRLLPRPVSSEDLATAMTQAALKTELWIALGAFQGLRAFEIAKLRREDIYDKRKDPMMLIRGKGNKERVLPLNAEVESLLRRFGMPARGYLFPNARGAPVQGGYVGKRISEHFTECGIDASAHHLRHYFASTLYAMTKDIRVVQEMMGHSSPNTTAIYVKYDALTAFQAVRSMTLRSTHPSAQIA